MSIGSLIDTAAAFDDRLPQPHGGSLAGAVDALHNGRLVVLCDELGASPRFDLVAAADRITVAQTAFLVRHTSGFLQVAMRDVRCDRLQIPPVAPGADRLGSQQCVGVDASTGIGTGISAADRTTTINALGRPQSVAGDFTRPGHVVPVRVAACPPRGDSAALALELAELSGSYAAVFATLVGVADAAVGLPDRRQAGEFAARHGLGLIDNTLMTHLRSV
ncbi:3,4-dihydroxy-2-butanone-4-phosphate synthase [Gordonia sp. ABSL1-1]|uniref:3,4-dihydroxy-2-butanone-4-phosphate synthase n=1 Tax=Gordonia sp. ABSL1-1 TaxID=3053923 RepID=UPI0025733A5F|nr:3,4-dihydroxy-2-butanone-4-phosphate synthase [Gordonia sp. ABSL1-1]MDL9938109.1 3,4-dihydroxy-2-butanone-4-phosphate synthase [Gordonia sp. ABSL1-1]